MKLLQAKTEAEKLEAVRMLEERRRELDGVKKMLEKLRPAVRTIDDGKIAVKCDPNDPLCGIE
jgi:hypothetical protein